MTFKWFPRSKEPEPHKPATETEIPSGPSGLAHLILRSSNGDFDLGEVCVIDMEQHKDLALPGARYRVFFVPCRMDRKRCIENAARVTKFVNDVMNEPDVD